MDEILNINKRVFALFAGEGWTVWIFFLVELLLIIRTKNRDLRYNFLYPSVIILLFIWNPICIKLFVNTGLLAENRYVRLYWLLPIGGIIAYACTAVIKSLRNRKKMLKLLVTICLIIIIVTTGNYIFTEINYSRKTNLYKLPKGVTEVVYMIREDVKKDGGKMWEIKIVVPPVICSYIRQYDGEVKMLYGRNIENDSNANEVRRLMNESVLDIEGIQYYARESACNYVILESVKEKNKNIEEYGYTFIGETEGYSIYKDILCE